MSSVIASDNESDAAPMHDGNSYCITKRLNILEFTGVQCVRVLLA
jgi:hypothetical protein